MTDEIEKKCGKETSMSMEPIDIHRTVRPPIVLFGVAGSGKNTVGKYIADKYHYREDAFANPLKEMVKIAFPLFTDEDLYGPSARRETQYTAYPMGGECLQCGAGLRTDPGGKKGEELRCALCSNTYPLFMNPRTALRTLGTEWGRRLYVDVWVEGLLTRIQNYPVPTVITDGRFPNEQSISAKRGAITVLLLRGFADSSATHASESSLKDIPTQAYTHVVDNRGPLDELPALLDHVMSLIREPLEHG